MMNFDSLRSARGYVREMDEEATEAIGDNEVWQFGNGEIVIVEPGTQASNDDNAKLVGLVKEVLY